MTTFCSNCGKPLTGAFCTACGSGAPSTATVAPAAAAAGGSSATKIILIVVGVLVLLGGMGVAGLVYVGYRAKQKIAQLKQDYGVTETATRSYPPAKGSGCPMLEGQQAAGILGVAVERVEFEAAGPDGSEWCRYFVSASERKRLMKATIAAGVRGAGKADAKSGADDVEKLVGGMLGAAIEAAGDNKAGEFAFSLQVWRTGGRAMWDKMEVSKADVKNATGVDFAGMATQQIDGIGDRAMVLPGGHSIMVLKGDAFFLIGFQQFVPGKEKTIALARAAVARV